MTSERTKSREHNRQGYDAWGKSYDTDSNSTVFADDEVFPAYYREVRGQRVLEIGCGTGRHTERLVAQGNEVTAIDLSAGMLAVAKAKPGLAGVRFVEGDVYETDVATGEGFDALVAALVLEHLDDLPGFFARVAAWLVPGGRAYFSEIHPSRMREGSGARFLGPDGEEIRLASLAHEEDDFHRAIAEAGLAILRQEDVIATPTLLAERSEWEKYRGRPMLQIWVLAKP